MAKKKSNAKRSGAVGEEVAYLLVGSGAHASPDDILARIRPAMRGLRPKGFAHSPWELLEHLRIAQHDILEWSLDANFVSPKWPDEYWPSSPKPPSASAWSKSAKEFRRELDRAVAIARNRKLDLLAPLAHSPDATLLGQLLLVADHNAYHLAQIVDVWRACS